MAFDGIQLRDSTCIVTTTLNSTALYGVGGSGQYLCVVHATTEDNVVKLGSTSDLQYVGVVQNKPAAGQAADICILGLTKIVTGSTVAHGELLCMDARGRAVSRTGLSSTSAIIGVARQSATAANQVITMLINPLGGILG